MKTHPLFFALLLGASVLPFTGCSTAAKKQPPAAAAAVGPSDGKSVRTDDLNEYAASSIADPIEPVNRATFWLNHQIYRFVLRPVSKTYEFILPKPVRIGVCNVFENVEFPVRFVNNVLQGNLPRAGQETGRFVVNSVAGVGGLIRVSDRIPALANVPPGETGQTFAKWGIGHGIYLVLPVIGPSSLRDGVGLAGDYALNPITWLGIIYGHWAWTIPVSVTDTIAFMPDKFDQYDVATENAVDPYLAVRSAWVQYRAEVAKK